MIFVLFFATQLWAQEVRFIHRDMPKGFNECHLCHINKSTTFVSKKQSTKLAHARVTTVHGKQNLACNHCHEKSNHNYLVRPANFKNSSPVCQQCHMETYKDFSLGSHGKRISGWKHAETQQFHCINCHDPHNVEFKKMESVAPPKLRRP